MEVRIADADEPGRTIGESEATIMRVDFGAVVAENEDFVLTHKLHLAPRSLEPVPYTL
jgi:hypothetical protein